ncbi:protein naked cuticle homolog 2 isoform X2 [Cephus cinctus]|uniref:Protein naked cuticle homolog n=1 Tax=Cephus cinctus TaxID=211228 RepID=A0AAJ7VW80_CEPCN|nr:protein naked cuticle homolog 2 isoform X2 [Cephus cinctus]
MATGLVKWWRARFLAGYKPFSVVGGGAEGSDAEELLASVATPCNSSPPPPPPLLTPPESPVTLNTPNSPTPPAANDEQANSNATRQLSFEEFECDVSVAEGDRRRQEFSFTLYDFDGHGKITKDDIAGLVTTIYDTLGASIQVPPCGSKTIKVKLTVSPDQRATQAHATPQTNPPNQGPSQASNSPSCCHVKHVTSCSHGTHGTHGTHASRRLPRRRRAPRHRCKSEHAADSHSEDDAENVPTSQSKQEELRRRVGPVPHLQAPYSNSSEGDVSDDSDATPSLTPLTPLTPLVTNQRKRSGAMQRQQLLEIIQANMEKNNLSFHASRKRHQTEQPRIPLRSPYTEPSSPCVQRCRPPPAVRHPTTYHKPVRENTHHHPSSLPKVPGKSRGNVRKPRGHLAPPTNTPTHPMRNHHHPQPPRVPPRLAHPPPTQNVVTPMANDNPQPTANVERASNGTNNQQQRTENSQHVQSQQSGKGAKKHQLKHATREQDQARAMAQVVRWLEREFSQGTAAAAAAAGRRHVHEHIHHHYHHYHAEALV